MKKINKKKKKKKIHIIKIKVQLIHKKKILKVDKKKR